MSWFSKLPIQLPFLGENPIVEYFFALNFSPQKITAAIWGIERGRLLIVNASETKLNESLEDISFDKLLDAATKALDEALADFPYEPIKILFGVPDNFLQDDNLKEEYLKLLRKLVKELDVSPMAYVSTTHAVSHLLQKEQGVPPTAVLVELNDPLTVVVVKGGRIEGGKEVKRTHSLAEDIQKGLLGITNVEVLPSRMLLYGSGEQLEKARSFLDELTSFPWMSKLPFLHLPKMEMLAEGIEIQAICLAGAVEIDPEVSFRVQVLPAASADGINRRHMNSADKDLGFVKGDIRRGEDSETERELSEDRNLSIETEREAVGHRSRQISTRMAGGGLINRSVMALFLAGGIFGRGRSGFVIPFFIVLILGALIAGYILLPKARVIVYVDPRVLEKEASVVADPGISVIDESAKKIPGKVVETELTGTGKGMATGKKQIGDPAKGKVIVYNATDKPVNLAQGAVLTADNGLKYKLDTSVQIASKSASADDPPTKSAAVGITAETIGPEGNLSALIKLKVSNFPIADVVAKVDEALSGGTSKEVTVVTSDDQKKLLAAVTSDLRKKAKDQLSEKLSGDLKILEEALSEQIIRSVYSKAVNDQADEFSLNLNARYKGTAYSENDLKTIVSKLIEVGVPEGYELKLENAETQSAVSKAEKDGKLIFTAKFKAKLMPKMDLEKIKAEIAGRALAEAGEKLKKLENVISTDIHLTPSIPGPFQRLPWLSKNIVVDVTTK